MGVVHHSVYYIWFEMGRTEWMRARDLSYRACEAKGWLLPVIECGCQYLNSTGYDDLIELETVFIAEKGVAFRFDYLVRNLSNGKLLAKGFTRHVCTNRAHKIDKTATKFLKSSFHDPIGLSVGHPLPDADIICNQKSIPTP